MRRAATLYFKLITIQLRSQLQYPFSFWTDTISTMILNGSFFLSVALVLERFGNISGWGLGEIAFLVGMIETSFATMDLLFSGFDPDRFSPMVRLGSFDQILLRPINLTLQILGSSFITRRSGRILEGLIILIISFSFANIHWTLGKILYIPVIFASQVIGFGALFIMGSTLTFWTIQPIEAVNILTYGGNEMMSYPMNIYPRWLRNFFTFAVPFIFLNYYPALYILDKPDPLHFPGFAPFLAPLAAAGMFAAAIWFWKFGIRHYQGTGS